MATFVNITAYESFLNNPTAGAPTACNNAFELVERWLRANPRRGAELSIDQAGCYAVLVNGEIRLAAAPAETLADAVANAIAAWDVSVEHEP